MSTALSRRNVIAGGIAIAALPLAAGRGSAGRQPFFSDAPLDPAGARRAAARRLGLQPLPVADLGRIAHDLGTAPRAQLTGIAGVTGSAAFFVVEQIAQRRGLRLRDRHGAWWAFGTVGAVAGRE